LPPLQEIDEGAMVIVVSHGEEHIVAIPVALDDDLVGAAAAPVASTRTELSLSAKTVADPVSVSPCQDSMETVPATDDLEPVLIEAADVSCKVPPTPVSA